MTGSTFIPSDVGLFEFANMFGSSILSLQRHSCRPRDTKSLPQNEHTTQDKNKQTRLERIIINMIQLKVYRIPNQVDNFDVT